MRFSAHGFTAVLIALSLAACTSGSDGANPKDEGTDDTDLVIDTYVPPPPNDCISMINTFEAQTTGVFDGEVNGYGYYLYQSAPVTSTAIHLRGCNAESGAEEERLITLVWYGPDRIQEGDYETDPYAFDNGGLGFGYSDGDPDSTGNCIFWPQGDVAITRSDFEIIEGTFDVNTRCLTPEGGLDRDTESRFVGSFAANNIGVE